MERHQCGSVSHTKTCWVADLSVYVVFGKPCPNLWLERHSCRSVSHTNMCWVAALSISVVFVKSCPTLWLERQGGGSPKSMTKHTPPKSAPITIHCGWGWEGGGLCVAWQWAKNLQHWARHIREKKGLSLEESLMISSEVNLEFSLQKG
jgi:hypothetical protein